MAAARVIIQKYNPRLITNKLIGEEGPIKVQVTSSWAKSLLYCMKFVKSRGSTITKYLFDDFEAIKK